jgi:hypothetical protein
MLLRSRSQRGLPVGWPFVPSSSVAFPWVWGLCNVVTVELFIERIDFSGHSTPFVRRVLDLNLGGICS